MKLFGNRKNKEVEYEGRRSEDREQQEYYDRNPLKVPSGCRACGGPYPSCKDSCSMFDD